MAESTLAPLEGKTCSKCGEFKLFSEFYAKGEKLHSRCKECHKAGVRDGRTRPRVVRPPDPEGFKTCRVCTELKPLEEMLRLGNGYRSRCKRCHLVIQGKVPYTRKQFPKPPPGHKWCTKCEECRPLPEFPKTQKGCGYGSWCKGCVAKHTRERYQNDPEVRADRLIRRQRWGAENPDWSLRWRAANLDRARENVRRGQARRRARMRGLPTEPYTLEQLLERDGTLCVLCDEELDLAATYPAPLSATVEHLECISWPASAGDTPANVALSHFTCNMRRGVEPHPAAARKRAELLAAEAAAS